MGPLWKMEYHSATTKREKEYVQTGIGRSKKRWYRMKQFIQTTVWMSRIMNHKLKESIFGHPTRKLSMTLFTIQPTIKTGDTYSIQFVLHFWEAVSLVIS